MFELSGPAEGYVSFALSLDKWMVGFKEHCFTFDTTKKLKDPEMLDGVSCLKLKDSKRHITG